MYLFEYLSKSLCLIFCWRILMSREILSARMLGLDFEFGLNLNLITLFYIESPRIFYNLCV